MNKPMSQMLKQYKSVESAGLESITNEATPHALISLLLQGALDRITVAITCQSGGDIAGKGQNISMAMNIIDGLRGSLDLEKGGEIADNLNNLYDFAVRTLFEANLENDLGKLKDVKAILGEIKAGWDAIESLVHPQEKQAPAPPVPKVKFDEPQDDDRPRLTPQVV